jgi:hypothetical protein
MWGGGQLRVWRVDVRCVGGEVWVVWVQQLRVEAAVAEVVLAVGSSCCNVILLMVDVLLHVMADSALGML